MTNDCTLFIVLAEQWKTAYLGKELLWKKKKKVWLSNNVLHMFVKHKAKNHTHTKPKLKSHDKSLL